eukprot:2249440-Amphidinium_carterae.1
MVILCRKPSNSCDVSVMGEHVDDTLAVRFPARSKARTGLIVLLTLPVTAVAFNITRSDATGASSQTYSSWRTMATRTFVEK